MQAQTKRFNKEKLQAAEQMLKQGAEDFTQRLKEIREKVQTKRGGSRLGSGRPKGSTKEEEAATERVIFRLTPSQLESIEAQTHQGESTAQAARRILLEALTNKNHRE